VCSSDLLASKDRTAALAQAKLIEADVGQGLIAAKIRSGEWGEAKKLFDTAMQNLDKLKLVQAKDAGKTTGGLKPGVTATDRFAMRVKLKSISDRMKDMLQSPEFQKKLDGYRVDLFLQEQSPYLDQLLQQQIPEDVRSFAILAKTFRNQKYREESGLAVTSYEQLRQYGAVPQPGDSSKVLADKLKTLDTGLINDINTDLNIYPALQQVGLSLGYGKTAPGGQPTAQRAAGGTAQVASEADIQQTMKANNLTREAAIQKIREAGYQIEGEGEEE
jgi:hypothetical protein